MSGRYDLTRAVLEGEHLLMCNDCGSIISDSGVSAHDRFHARADPFRDGYATSADDPVAAS